MSNVQVQDLIFHNDHSLVSDAVLNQGSQSYLSIVSHEQGTSPSWLLNSLIENSLVGSSNLVNSELKRLPNGKCRSHVYFTSFLHPLEYYSSNCVKNGLDITKMENFTFIDAFSNLFTEVLTDDGKDQATQLRSFFKEKISSVVTDPKSIVFIEFPEILLTSTSITSNVLLSELNKINKICKQLFIISGQDYPQSIDLNVTNPNDLIFKVSDFLAKLYHKSQLNINLMPLPTGRAKDITGCITISQGTVPYVGTNLQVVEREYIYLVAKDGNVKLFFR